LVPPGLNAQKFAMSILEQEPKVLFVAVVESRADTVLASEMRKGASLYYPAQYIHDFVMIAPALVMGALEKLQPALGAITSVMVRYERRVLLFSRIDDLIAVLGFEESISTPFADQMAELIRRVAKESE
jgi:hypothetical protein